MIIWNAANFNMLAEIIKKLNIKPKEYGKSWDEIVTFLDEEMISVIESMEHYLDKIGDNIE